ncbi:hypothetical protein [Roseovarius sp.]|uniref:hypothetical protein n=1 Tax=Roseovarius sp. TaxID=1486281 RepID=UPI003BAB8308
MAELKSSGQTALRARAKRKEAERLEAEAEGSSDSNDCLKKTKQAMELHKEARDLERASRWFEYFENKNRGNRGIQQKTKDRIEFLCAVSKSIGGASREAIAEECVRNHSEQVRNLWNLKGKAFFRERESRRMKYKEQTAAGKSAQIKILNFMNNKGVP